MRAMSLNNMSNNNSNNNIILLLITNLVNFFIEIDDESSRSTIIQFTYISRYICNRIPEANVPEANKVI